MYTSFIHIHFRRGQEIPPQWSSGRSILNRIISDFKDKFDSIFIVILVFECVVTTANYNNKCVVAVEKTHNFEENLDENRAKWLLEIKPPNLREIKATEA